MVIVKQFISLLHICYKFISIFAIFFTACTFNQNLITEKNVSITNPLWIKHQQQLSKITKFQISGTFSCISKNNKTYAKFFWRQYTLNHYRLLFINPLGRTELELNVTPKSTQIIDRNGKKYVNNYSILILNQLIGIEILIKNLPYWIIGLATNASSFKLNKNGLLKSLKYKENNKTLYFDYLSYYQNINPKLPSYIEINQDTIRIKLKINNWILN